MKITFIIPTMWRSKRTTALLESLEIQPEVEEIIVIDNDRLNRPELPNIDKLNIITSGRNMYVNPSWNLGVRMATTEYIALCNDDITFDARYIGDILNNIKPGMIIGQHSENYELKEQAAIYTHKITARCNGYGCLMFMRTEDYHEIPEVMKVSFGDDFLFSRLNSYVCRGLKIETEMSTTSSEPEFIQQAENDSIEWHKLNR